MAHVLPCSNGLPMSEIVHTTDKLIAFSDYYCLGNKAQFDIRP